MSGPSIIFFSIFVLPLVAFMIWLMRQDRRKGATGLIILAIIVIAAITYSYLTREEAKKQPLDRSGTVVPKDT